MTEPVLHLAHGLRRRKRDGSGRGVEMSGSASELARTAAATRSLAGVSIPDTPLITRAIEFAREGSEPYLFNHAMRSWLFAAIFAQRKQITHDQEVLAVTTILHEIGLTNAFDGPLRFEVEGANAVRLTRPSKSSHKRHSFSASSENNYEQDNVAPFRRSEER